MDIKLVNKFLWYFWNPLIKILKDNDKANGYSISKIYDLQTILEINKSNPYWVHFTPNWNLWDKNNTIWLEWKWNASKDHCDNYISCLYTDFDLRATNFESLAEFKDAVLETIRASWTKPHFFIQSWWGFHVYWLIEEASRQRIALAYRDKYWDILNGIAEMLVYWEKDTHDISSNMRLPWTAHWKTWVAKDVKIWVFDKDLNLQEFTENREPSWYITYKNIQIFVENDLNMSPEEWRIVWRSSQMNKILNDVSIVDILKQLYAYPRTFQWIEYKYLFDERSKSIYFEKDWRTYRPWWYKVNVKENYVHCFSFDKHDINERPRWWVWIFLYNYFERDWNKVNEFMKNEFSIDLTDDAWVWEAYLTLECSNGKMFFTSNWVLYSYTINKKDWPVQVDSRIIKRPIIPKGILKTKNYWNWETENDTMLFILTNAENWDEYVIEFCESQKKFNKLYWENWLIFFGNDMMLLEFFYTLWEGAKKKVIKEYNHMYLSWWYKDYYIVGWKAYNKFWDILNNEEHSMSFRDIETIDLIQWEDTTIAEYSDMLQTIFSSRISVLWLLWFIACLCWQKFWSQIKDNIDMFIMPSMFVSWRTKSGKSTLYNLIRRWFWIDLYRKISLWKWGWWTTAQPIKQQATDDFILHMEEFTWDIPIYIETLIRSIINQSTIKTWQSDWHNLKFSLKSALIIDWENLPESESVWNRFLVLPMFESDKIWNPELLEEIKKYSFFKDFLYKLYSVNIEQLKEYCAMAKKELQWIWVSGRQLVIYWYIYITNKIFLLMDDEELLKIIQSNTEVLCDIESSYDELSRIISDLYSRYRIKPSTSLVSSDIQHIHIMIPEDYKNKNKIIITWLMRKYAGKILLNWNTLTIKISSTDHSDNNKELFNIVKRFEKYLEVKNTSVLDQ